MSCQITPINTYSSSGIKGLLSDKEGYAIHSITYQDQKYFIELEWRLVYHPFFREYTRHHDRRLNRRGGICGRPGGVAACIYSYRENFNFLNGHKGEKLFETSLTKLTLDGKGYIRLYQIEPDALKIHLPEIMQIVFNRWEYVKQSPSETEAEIRAAGSRLGWGGEPLDEAELGVLRMQAAVRATEAWDGIVRELTEREGNRATAPKATEELDKNSSSGHQAKFFYELFKECGGEEDVIRLVSAFTRTYATSHDPFWQKAEAALLTALCLQIYLWDRPQNCKANLESYLKDLQTSDREQRTARADIIFAKWSSHWPKTAPKYYNYFLMSTPKTQEQIIKSAQSLFQEEIIESREGATT